MEGWAAVELKQADLGDARRNKRLIRIVEDLAAQPNASVPQACSDTAATQAAYEFWSSPRVKVEAIRQAHQYSTVERIKEHQVVLAIQDTTELNFTHHPGKKGLGYLDHAKSLGLKVHSVFCVSTSGVPLGILDQLVWTRDPASLGKKHQRHKKQTQDKESQRWLTAMDTTQTAIPSEISVVSVTDQEGDIYDLFALPRRPGSEFLIRAHHDRCVKTSPESEEIERLHLAIRQVPTCGQLTLELKRHPERAARQANLTVRFTTLELQPPQTHLNYSQIKPMTVQVILAEEENPPPQSEKVSWLLVTTLSVTSFEDVLQCLRWYSYRWLIERYHFVLKSGCRIEQLQLETADRIQKALATYSIVAWRLLWITYSARYNPDSPSDTVLETHEWQALYCTIHKTPIPPQQPPTLNTCVRWIAQLGGFLGRKADGDPGVKTIWQGLRRLHDIAATWKLVKSFDVKKDVTNA